MVPIVVFKGWYFYFMPHKDPEAKKRYLKEWRERKLASDDPVERAKAERNRERDSENSRSYRDRKKDDPEFKAAKAATNKKWQTENLEHLREYGKEYRANNKDRVAELSRQKYLRWKHKVLDLLGVSTCPCGCDDIRVFNLHHPELGGNAHRREHGNTLWKWASTQTAEVVRKLHLLCANCHAKEHRSDKPFDQLSAAGRSKRRLRERVRAFYGCKCNLCDHTEDLHLDHINGGGKAERSSGADCYREAERDPSRFRLLCPNHNLLEATRMLQEPKETH